MNSIGVGTFGYDHEQWSGGFYDPRLPPDWRFQYYANQFRAILLPWQDSRELLAARKPELVNDSDDGFRFVLELGLTVDPTSLGEIPADLRRRIAGLVVGFDLNAGGPDALQRAVDQCRELEGDWPVCLDPGPVSDALMRTVAEASLACCLPVIWRPETSETPDWRGALRITRLGDVALGRMRKVLEQMACGYRPGIYAGIFFDGTPTAPQKALECRLLAELMGH